MSSQPSTAQQTPDPFAEIVVQGYSSRYAAAAKRLLVTEGGYVDDPKDHGGATKLGISLRFLAAEGAFDRDGDGLADFDLDMDGDIDGRDIRALTRGDALYLYYTCFWARFGCETFPRPLGEMLFDQAVNGGGLAAKKILQRAINACVRKSGNVVGLLTIDGRLGPATQAKLAWVLERPSLGMPALIVEFREEVETRYRLIADENPSQKRFLQGWLNRASALGRDA